MPRSTIFAVLAALAVTLLTPGAPAKAQFTDPAVHGLERLEPLKLGVDNDTTKMAPMEYRLRVGQGYRWEIEASDLTEYAFVAPEFIRNIWIRKIEVGEVEIKVVTFDELEFESGGEAEVFFVAVRPGTYEFGSKGLMERDVVGRIIVESADGSSLGAPAATEKKEEKTEDDDDDY